MSGKSFKQHQTAAHHIGGALHHGNHHHCRAGSAPVFVAFHPKTYE
jgi:hypothetical protein